VRTSSIYVTPRITGNFFAVGICRPRNQPIPSQSKISPCIKSIIFLKITEYGPWDVFGGVYVRDSATIILSMMGALGIMNQQLRLNDGKSRRKASLVYFHPS
jgi:hypothetical protein